MFIPHTHFLHIVRFILTKWYVNLGLDLESFKIHQEFYIN